jgi:AcrR family transcriptional regulator
MAAVDEAVATRPTGPPRSPTRRYEARRNAILASAVDELNRKGVRGMTLGGVAARLGLVPTGVIYYFRSKEELAAACFMRGLERYRQLIAAGEAAGRDDRARLEGFVRAYFEFKHRAVHGEAEPVAVFNDVRALGNQAVGEAYTEMFRHARKLLKGAPGAELPRLDRNARTHLLLSEIFWSVAWLGTNPREDYLRVGERMAGILANGLTPPGAVWPRFAIPRLVCGEADKAADPSELFLRAATELINDEGYHGASVERISARLKVSKGAFYHHNEAKDELVVACFERTFEIMWRAIRAAEAEGGTGLKVLAQVCSALVRYQLAGNLPLLRTSALTTVPESIHADLMRRFDRISHRFASIISDGIADGSVRPLDVNIAAQMISAMVNASSELKHWAPGLTPEAAATHYVRPMFEGLLSPIAANPESDF